MMHVLLIHAGPTPWDLDDRITGAENLPLAPQALAPVTSIIDSYEQFHPDAIFCPRGNEACQEVAKLMADRSGQKIRYETAFAEFKLGLWEGLTRDQFRHRYPTVTQQWQDNPTSVVPPEGESLAEVVDRLYGPLEKIYRKFDGRKVVFVLRPLVMAIIGGILRAQPMNAFSADLAIRRSHDEIESSDFPTRERIG